MLLALVISTIGCRTNVPPYTALGVKVLLEQRDVSLFRKKPEIWSARGYVTGTKDHLIFVPLTHYGIPIHGTDSTFIRLSDIDGLRKEKWMLVFPFGLDVITEAGVRYPFISVRRNKLLRGIQELQATQTKEE